MGSRSGLARLWRAVAAVELLVIDGLMAVVMAIMPLMAIAITWDVFARYVLNSPTIWISDASAYALLWVAFLASPWLVRHNEHVRGEFATARLGPRNQAVLGVVLSLAGAAVMAVVLWQVTTQTLDDYAKNVSTTGSWEIPRAYIWMVMPVGSLFTMIELLRAAWVAGTQLRGGVTPSDAPTASLPKAI